MVTLIMIFIAVTAICFCLWKAGEWYSEQRDKQAMKMTDRDWRLHKAKAELEDDYRNEYRVERNDDDD